MFSEWTTEVRNVFLCHFSFDPDLTRPDPPTVGWRKGSSAGLTECKAARLIDL
jgi:hypothetical protein